MLFYTWQETLLMVAAAIMTDLLIGDPRWPTHPVIRMGQWINWAVSKLYGKRSRLRSRFSLRWRGIVLTVSTLFLVFVTMWLLLWLAAEIHPWLGYAANTWFIATTIAVKGLKDAALQVYRPLSAGKLDEARKYVGYIVGRDTTQLNESEITRATVETVAENTVDAVVSPLFYALLGAAPLALTYRAANTLDSMVGYKNDKYLHFGWASARWDDIMNWLPARITGVLLVSAAVLLRGCSPVKAVTAIFRFAALHPSPNGGIPESAVAGALGIELGGVNVYHGQISDRARMGWPLRERQPGDILLTIRLLYTVSYLVAGGLLCALCWIWL
ncbi:adenosylcobinamide-phosphate synthase CbiB [Paenibacillus xerothermodurans]|uniref:Cobalamin biosynthesis protein CobD n=1 Tax=Paenibacillus xerothermodurans TaxID=1977292 RepID=A0A2W1NLP7_PAEXE|nr:adenosylcobinamide-phosphate synthase CbiB [Paenibacillus xerothermodurans]PZE20375.1 cobalamin biosynthesis protein CobD [Paenibacillus xerothermodurans]